MAKNPNGGSTPKTPDTPEKQNELRKEKKAAQRRRSGGGSRRPTESFTSGLAQDRLNADAVVLMDALGHRMVSSSKAAQSIMHTALYVFIDTYTKVTDEELRSAKKYRDEYAVDKAVAPIKECNLAGYIRSTIKNATTELRRSKRPVNARS